MRIMPLGPPGAAVLTLSEMKAHLRLDHDDDDALLVSLEAVARQHLEQVLDLSLLARPYRIVLDAWPEGGVLAIPLHPVASIDGLAVLDDAGVPQPVDAALYLDASGRPARLVAEPPPRPLRPLSGIAIGITAGFGEAGPDVPPSLRRALLLQVAALHATTGASPAEAAPAMPEGWDRLVAPYRMARL